MTSESPIPIVFISGPGRSGSTLLDHILGQLDGFLSVGELRFIWQQSFAQNTLCGCGEQFRDCGFWNRVIDEAFGGFDQVDHEELYTLRRAVDHPYRMPTAASPLVTKRFQSQHTRYARVMERLTRALLEVSGARFIVDSSKEPMAAALLATIPGVQLHLIHLVRDSRAVAFSWMRKKHRRTVSDSPQFMPTHRPWASTLKWIYRNVTTELLPMIDPGAGTVSSRPTYQRLRYEDLIESPAPSLEGILRQLGVSSDALSPVIDGNRVQLSPKHTVWGNPMRFRKGEIELVLDDEWRRAMKSADRGIVTAMTLPLLQRYGYR